MAAMVKRSTHVILSLRAMSDRRHVGEKRSNAPLSKAGSAVEVARVDIVRLTGSLAALLVTHGIAIRAGGGIAISGGLLGTS